MSDEFIIPPPSNATVWHDHRPVLYTGDGQPLVRQAGFVMAGQTSGTFPQLKTKPKSGKKGTR